jgi:hypothetical protein
MMKTKRHALLVALMALLPASPLGCRFALTYVGEDPLASGGAGGTGGTIGTGGMGGAGTAGSGGATVCMPGATQPCYDGPAGTEGQGICKAGTQTCAADGASWGPCLGEVLPKPEDCATPYDEDCDGLAPACTGKPLWAERFGASGNQAVFGVATDGQGDVIIVGKFAGTVDFGGGVLASAGGQDVFVAKLDANGNHIWSKSFGDPSDQVGASVAVDSGGNVVLTGYFAGTVDFGGGPLVSAGGQDIFVVKLDAGGGHVWSKRFGDASNQYGTHVAMSGTGDVLLVGSMGGAADFGGGPLASAGGQDIFVAKLDANGDHVWSERFGDSSDQYSTSVAVDGGGSLVLTGYFAGAVSFGGGPLASAGGQDIFVAKLDANGGHVWSKRFGDASDQYGASIAVDSGGNVFLTGDFPGTVDFGGGPLVSAGGQDIFVAKLDANGDHVWSKRFGDISNQGGASVAVDNGGNVVLTGYVQGPADFGGGPLPSAGGDDLFVAKFDANGAHVWSKRFGDASDQEGTGIATDGEGDVVVVGNVRGQVDFGSGALPDGGGIDVAVVKFVP